MLEESNWNFDTGLLLPVETGGTFQLGFAHSNQLTNNQFTFVNPSTTDLLSLSFTQPLLRGGWHEYATSQQKLARLEYKKQIERTREARRLLLLDVTNTYWDVVAAREELRVAGITHELAKRQLEQNQRRLEAGVGTEVEVLQAEANVAVRVQEALDAKVGVAEAVDALKRILFPGTDGRTWSYEILPVTPIPEPGSDPATSWRAALAVALEERAELALQRYEIEASEVRLAQTESEQRPGLDLILSANGRGFDGDPEEAIGEALGLDFPSTSAGLRFSFPLLNRTARNAYFAARSALRSAHLVYDQLETQVASEVRTSLRQVLYQAQALEAARVSLDLAKRQLEAEEARLREGLSTTFTVLEFQRELAAALSSETAARVAYAKALAALLAAQGRLDTELQ